MKVKKRHKTELYIPKGMAFMLVVSYIFFNFVINLILTL